MKAAKFHEMKMDELTAQLKELKERLFKLRFSHATGQLANPLEMAGCKKDIARVKTILKERETKGLAAAAQKEKAATAPTKAAAPAKTAKKAAAAK
jgi:large subunit ribosomal protein L29